MPIRLQDGIGEWPIGSDCSYLPRTLGRSLESLPDHPDADPAELAVGQALPQAYQALLGAVDIDLLLHNFDTAVGLFPAAQIARHLDHLADAIRRKQPPVADGQMAGAVRVLDDLWGEFWGVRSCRVEGEEVLSQDPMSIEVAVVLAIINPGGIAPVIDWIALHPGDPEAGEPAVREVGFEDENMISRTQGTERVAVGEWFRGGTIRRRFLGDAG